MDGASAANEISHPPEKGGIVTAECLDSLLNVLRGARAILILPHNDPDPDAIAGAVALRYLIQYCLDIPSDIAYGGIIGRAENQALVHELGDPLHPLWPSDLEQEVPIALIDTQPGSGNNSLPPGRKAAVVLDHHLSARAAEAESTDCKGGAGSEFADLRPSVGAISTVLTEYIQSAGIEPPPALATALFYGIKTDTRGLSRGASQLDVDAYFYLQRRADLEMLARIEQAQVSSEYFRSLVAALHAVRRYDHLVVSYMQESSYPDLVAEVADFLLRLKGIRWVLCMGVYEGVLILSVRTRLAHGAARLIQHIVGPQGTAGGHGSLAGGQIPLDGQDADVLARTVIQRALYHLEIESSSEGEWLIPGQCSAEE
jgi:nanoRNase/pAp phosphatase (c-di-AMP/oligoRNAs hydrolase)